jgi:hypothetical protein
MKTRKTPTSRLSRFTRTGLLAAAVTAILGGSAIAPAFADEWRRGGEARGHEWRGGEARGQEWRGGEARGQEWRGDHERFEHRRDFYAGPRFGYAAPGYYYHYAPAPYYAVPSLNFVFR